jgi:putative tryptophan/tyrosine transport system substrate-binding protein
MKRAAVTSILVAVVLLALGVIAEAEQPKKVPRIGYLSPSDAATESTRSEPIRRALRERGYIEGQNIAIEYRYAEGKIDLVPELAAELVRLKVDIIVVSGGLGTIQAVKNATKTIPIVMVGLGIDPVVSGLIDSLAHPGGNVTWHYKPFQRARRKAAGAAQRHRSQTCRVAVLYESDNPGSLRELKEVLPVAARELRLTVQPRETRDADGFEKVFAALNKERPDGLYVTQSPLMNANLKRTIDFGLRSRLPSVGSNTEYVDAGGLMSYDADLADSYRRVAYYVDRILKGTKPADLPVEQPTKFEFVINLKTAKQIGLTIPPEVLARANRLIK